MKIVITGATGNVGTALIRALAGTGDELVGIARRCPPADHEQDTHVSGGRESDTCVRWVSCDIGDPASAPVLADACAGAGAVVHLAWAVQPRCTDPPMARTNAAGSARVLRAAAAAGVGQVVCASSAAAYRPGPRWRPVDERAPLGGVPGSAYSLAKAYLETQLDEFERRQPSIRVARIRPCGIAQGEAAGELADWLLPRWLPRSLIGRRWLPVPLWKDLRLQLVHADDVAAAVALILRQRATGAFNLAAEPVLPAAALAGVFGGFRLPCSRRAALAVARASWRLGLQPLHPGWLTLADRARLVDGARARRELGWSPRHDAVAVCAELAAAMRSDRRGHSAALAPTRPALRLGRPTHQSQDPPR